MTPERTKGDIADRFDLLARPNKNKRAMTRTIRLDEEIDLQLEQMAERGRTSVNNVIANALSQYVDWTRHLGDIRNATVSIALLQKMMDHLTIDQAKSLGVWYGENPFVELVNSRYGRVRFTSIVATLVLMSRYSGLFQLQHDYVRSKHHLRIHHSSGLKWTKFYEEFLLTVFKRTNSGLVEVVSSTENLLSISIEEPLVGSVKATTGY